MVSGKEVQCLLRWREGGHRKRYQQVDQPRRRSQQLDGLRLAVFRWREVAIEKLAILLPTHLRLLGSGPSLQ